MNKKKNFSDEINKQKQIYSATFQTLFNKKTIDEQTLDHIKNMLPNNRQINDIINEFNELTKK